MVKYRHKLYHYNASGMQFHMEYFYCKLLKVGLLDLVQVDLTESCRFD